MRASFNGVIPFDLTILKANASSKAEIYPRVIIPGSREFPLVSLIYVINAPKAPSFEINLAKSGDYLAISLIQVAAFFLTSGSMSLRQLKILGKIFSSTTTLARETACLEIYARQLQT